MYHLAASGSARLIVTIRSHNNAPDAVTALLAAALPGLTVAGEAVVKAAASPAAVQIDNFHFAPATLTITAGTTVT